MEEIVSIYKIRPPARELLLLQILGAYPPMVPKENRKKD